MIWDFTCADTVCQSYIKSTCRKAGEAARIREQVKTTKYASLSDNFFFCPIAIEAFGSFGSEGRKLVDEIGKKLQETTGEKKSKSFLLSIANQRGNAASILGTIPQTSEKLDAIYYVI